MAPNAGKTKTKEFERRGRKGLAENAEGKTRRKKGIHLYFGILCVLCGTFAPSAFKIFFKESP